MDCVADFPRAAFAANGDLVDTLGGIGGALLGSELVRLFGLRL